ncbi:hypothetical protein DEIGR_102547 [Deinococcus grandis]|uniref:Uncharacterized protein n=1 Tax=Deinococcus grandis TaxID=57498 RepID=A0A100HN46_9DEIO|nr:hypothetical protein [Deinococcus grandis]GAQ22520.1 hypothetical protein DEIGR_102547 [Deinococcus grandis]
MRRLLPLLLLTTLTTAHAAYCYDVPGEDRTLLPRFQGAPRQVTEERRVSDPAAPDEPARTTTRTFTFQGSRMTQVQTRAPGDQTWTLLTLTGQAGYQRAWVGLEGVFSGRSVTLAQLQKQPREPITLTFDTQGRLTAYSGVWEDQTLQAMKEQVSCTYSAAKRQVVERVTRAGLISQVTAAQLDTEGRLISREIVATLPGSGLRNTRQSTYIYAPGGSGIRVEETANGQTLPAVLLTTDAAGRVTHIEMADLGDVQEQWRIEYDARGNWVRQVGTMQGQTFMTITRRITY